MAMKRRSIAAIGLVSLACLGMVTIPDVRTASKAQLLDDVEYVLGGDSLFAQGCMGSQPGHYDCMCPMMPADEFAGGLIFTPRIHTPPGHQTFDVVVEDWVFIFDGEETEVTGSGLYDRWTDLEGDRWQSMTLDLDVYGEEVHFYSGVREDTTSSGAPPAEIYISLLSDTYCFGYWILIDAELVPRYIRSAEDCAKEMHDDDLTVADDSP